MKKLMLACVLIFAVTFSHAASPNVSRVVDVLDFSSEATGWYGALRVDGEAFWKTSFKRESMDTQLLLTTHSDGVVAEVMALVDDTHVYHYVPLVNGETTSVDLNSLPESAEYIFVMMTEPVLVSLLENGGDFRTLENLYNPKRQPLTGDLQSKFGFGCRDLTVCNKDWTLTCTSASCNNAVVTDAGKIVVKYVPDPADPHGIDCLVTDKTLTWGCHSGIEYATSQTVSTNSSCGCMGSATWTLSAASLTACPDTVVSKCPGGPDLHFDVTM